MTCTEIESKKEWICICVTDSLCCTAETNTTLYINYTPIKIKKKKKKLPNLECTRPSHEGASLILSWSTPQNSPPARSPLHRLSPAFFFLPPRSKWAARELPAANIHNCTEPSSPKAQQGAGGKVGFQVGPAVKFSSVLIEPVELCSEPDTGKSLHPQI